MKTKLIPSLGIVCVLAAMLLAVVPAHAQILGIGPGSSSTNFFFDSGSYNPSSVEGADYYDNIAPWTGSSVGVSATDPNTLDVASDSVGGSSTINSYSVNVNGASLTQQTGNTGSADLNISFLLDFQIGPGGMGPLATEYPIFTVSGNVGTAAGSYASLTGTIDYYANGVFSSPAATVTYSFSDTTLGNVFNNAPVTISVNNSTLPALNANSDLYVFANFDLETDPASISLEPAPEPSSSLLMGLAGICVIGWRRWTAK